MIDTDKYLAVFMHEGLMQKAYIPNAIKLSLQTSKRSYIYSNCYVSGNSTPTGPHIADINKATNIRILRIPLTYISNKCFL